MSPSPPVPSEKRISLSSFVLWATICPVALRWGGAGIVDQPATAGLLLAVLVYSGAWVIRPTKLRWAPGLLVILLLLIVLVLSYLLHNTPDGLALLPRVALFATAGFCLASVEIDERDVSIVARFGIFITILAFIFSALIIKMNIFAEFLRYFLSFDYNRVTFYVLRPIYNAFLPGAEIEYLASVSNSVSAGLVVLLIIVASGVLSGVNRNLTSWVALFFCFILLLVLFSSASVLIVSIWAFVVGISVLRRGGLALIFALYGATMLVTLSYLLGVDPLALVAARLDGDVASRAARLVQYEGALSLLGSKFLFGAGFLRIEGHEVHNLPLFAWVSGGLPALALVMVIYAQCGFFVWRGMRLLSRNGLTMKGLLLSGLPIVMFVRTLVGGGGGLPDMASCLALGLCYAMSRKTAPDADAIYAVIGGTPSGRAVK